MFGEFLSAHALNLACYGAFVAVFAVVERLRPVERQSPQWAGTIYGDAVFAIISAPLFGVLSLPIPLTAAYIAYGFFAHANLRISLGWPTPVFVGPQYHCSITRACPSTPT